MSFELPENLSELTDEQLNDLLSNAITAFDESDTNDRDALREISVGVQAIRAEQGERAEIADMQATVDAARDANTTTDDATDPDDGDADGTDDGDDDNDAATADANADQPEPVAASGSTRQPRINRIRDRQPDVTDPGWSPTPAIVAAADVPGHSTGSELDISQAAAALYERAGSLQRAGKDGNRHLVASVRMDWPEHLTVNDAQNVNEGTQATLVASDQSRLDGGNIVASGGWCAPSEQLYDIAQFACAEGLIDLPEIQLNRGGIRYFPTPQAIDPTFFWTEADDIAAGEVGSGDEPGPEKPCFRFECPEPIEVRCDITGVCIEMGILTRQFFPELVEWNLRNAMIKHEMVLKREQVHEMALRSTPVVAPETFGAFTAVLEQVAIQAEQMREQYDLCESIGIEVVFPHWVLPMFVIDLARQTGRSFNEVTEAEVRSLFAAVGVRAQFANGLVVNSFPPPAPGAAPVTWPSQVQFLIYPAGAWELGRGPSIDLGPIYDSTLLKTNDYTAVFSEECTALIDRGPESRLVTVPVCASGAQAALESFTCPTGFGDQLGDGDGSA